MPERDPLAEARARHERHSTGWCRYCGQVWPCDAAVLGDALGDAARQAERVAALGAVAEAARQLPAAYAWGSMSPAQRSASEFFETERTLFAALDALAGEGVDHAPV